MKRTTYPLVGTSLFCLFTLLQAMFMKWLVSQAETCKPLAPSVIIEYFGLACRIRTII